MQGFTLQRANYPRSRHCVHTYLRFLLVLLPQVKRLSLAAVSTETALTEAKSKVEGLARQLKNVQQRMEASEGLERDLRRLGQEAEEMHQKSHRVLDEKQVRVICWNGSRLLGSQPV